MGEYPPSECDAVSWLEANPKTQVRDADVATFEVPKGRENGIRPLGIMLVHMQARASIPEDFPSLIDQRILRGQVVVDGKNPTGLLPKFLRRLEVLRVPILQDMIYA